MGNSADAILKPASRTKSGKVPKRPGHRPGRPGSSAGGNGGAGSITRLAAVIPLAAAVFLVGFICDTGALARLFWASLAGQVGLPARLGAFAIVLLLGFALVAGFFRPARVPPTKQRRTATPRAARNEEQKPRTRAVDSDPAEVKPAVTRSRRKKPDAALNPT